MRPGRVSERRQHRRQVAVIKYSKDHVWIDVDGDRCRIGITEFAQKELGDVVHVELPDVGAKLRQGESFGTIESAKAISELYAPVSGEVVEVNGWVKIKPGSVNTTPMATWLVEVAFTNAAETSALLDADAYATLVSV